MARGGKRTGSMGRPYTNRSDLRQSTTAPATAPTGLPYGEHKALVDAQRTVPVGSPPTPGAGVPPPVGGGPAGYAGPQPGTLPFIGPTQRPDEPMQAGLASGPGPGPEALRGVGANLGQSSDTAAGVVRMAASTPGASPDVLALAQFVAGGSR